jgi:UDP-N-acetylglucosamine--N-acetylmuramyl-(pentapeptide) pyrophosphoryl-undecaprenol N-acetylglucosamine transferase
VHQTGERDAERTRLLYGKLGIKARVLPFIENLPLVLRTSHLAVSRSGGTTLAELAASALPAILLPYPHAAANHQRKNADVFTSAGAAYTLDEREVSARLDHRLASLVTELASVDRLRVRMADSMTRLARPEAALHG